MPPIERELNMFAEWVIWGIAALSLLIGLVAGVFLAFSDFVMPSLLASKPAAGSEAMQVINRKVYASIFIVLLVGLIPVTAVVGGLAYLFLEGAAALWLMVGGAIYFAGVFLASMVGNIPMNRRLEAMPQGGAEAQAYWPSYVRGWQIWNHMRTVSSFATMGCYVIAAVLLAQGI